MMALLLPNVNSDPNKVTAGTTRPRSVGFKPSRPNWWASGDTKADRRPRLKYSSTSRCSTIAAADTPPWDTWPRWSSRRPTGLLNHVSTKSVKDHFDNRVAWTKSCLKPAGLLETPRRAVFRITSRGQEVLSTPSARACRPAGSHTIMLATSSMGRSVTSMTWMRLMRENTCSAQASSRAMAFRSL